MNDQDLRTYEMFLRVGTFGAAEAAAFPATSRGAQLFATIAAAAAELADHVAAQLAGTNAVRAGSSTKATARDALRRSLERIRRTARAMAHETPGLDNKFRIPRTPTDQELVAIAKVFGADALPIKSEFIKYALPATFVDDLNAQLTDFNEALTRQNEGKEGQVTATAAIEDAVDRALAALRPLDVIVRNTFHEKPAKLAAWESAKHVERAARKKAAAPAPPANVPPAA